MTSVALKQADEAGSSFAMFSQGFSVALALSAIAEVFVSLLVELSDDLEGFRGRPTIFLLPAIVGFLLLLTAVEAVAAGFVVVVLLAAVFLARLGLLE